MVPTLTRKCCFLAHIFTDYTSRAVKITFKKADCPSDQYPNPVTFVSRSPVWLSLTWCVSVPTNSTRQQSEEMF